MLTACTLGSRKNNIVMILRKGKKEIRGKVSKKSEIKWNERRDEMRCDAIFQPETKKTVAV